LKQMTSDSNEYVRSEAIRYIKELQQDMEDADPEVSTKTSANAKDDFSIEQFAKILKPRPRHHGETDEEYYKDMGFNSTLDVELRFEPRLSNEAWLELSARTADLIENAKDGFRSKMEMSEHAVLSDKYQLPDFETAYRRQTSRPRIERSCGDCREGLTSQSRYHHGRESTRNPLALCLDQLRTRHQP